MAQGLCRIYLPASKWSFHNETACWKEKIMTIGTILLLLLILMLVGALPTWPHSRSWGYYPSGGLGVVLVILVILLLTGVI
jgi:hypothetical protein